jgi:hypothetical protein
MVAVPLSHINLEGAKPMMPGATGPTGIELAGAPRPNDGNHASQLVIPAKAGTQAMRQCQAGSPPPQR